MKTILEESELRSELLIELKGYRKLDKNVPLYEKGYHQLFGTSLRTMTSSQINDMLIFITNMRLCYENRNLNCIL